MDVDLVKSATEDQMEMMMMMMQMGNKQLQTEFSSGPVPHSEINDLSSSIQFSGINGTGIDSNMTMTMNMNMNMNMNTTTSTTTLANFENPHLSSPTLINHPSSASFIGDNSAMQEPVFSNSMRQHVSDLSGAFTTYNHPTSNSRRNSMAAMREMIFRIAAMQPIHIDPESVKPPKRRNVKISKDPQSIAARHRRERISERIRILQRLVPGGTKMDTASMLDEAIHYVKFLKTQVQSLEKVAVNCPMGLGLGTAISNGNFSSLAKAFQLSAGVHGQAFNSNTTHQMLN